MQKSALPLLRLQWPLTPPLPLSAVRPVLAIKGSNTCTFLETTPMDIELTPAQMEEFKDALLAAFDRSGIQQVVRFGLGVTYAAIVPSGTLDAEMMALVEWANSNNQVDALLTEARKKNPGNVKLRTFETKLRAQTPPPPPPDLPTDSQPVLEQPSDETLEALIFGLTRDTRLPYAFIEGAQRTARSIARLTVPRIFDGQQTAGWMSGTGWLIAPGVLMTNYHVIEARDKRPKPQGLGEAPAKLQDFSAQAEQVTVHFDYFEGGEPDEAKTVRCTGARLLAQNRELDFAVIELTEAHKVADRPPLRLPAAQPTLARGDRMNIVQHPQGGAMRFAIRNNFFVMPGNRPYLLWYQTDTEPGASGSPVCDDDWRVVALHRAATGPLSPLAVPQEVISGSPVMVRLLNEAVRIHDVLAGLPAEVRARVVTG